MIKQISILLLMVILAGCGTRRVAEQIDKSKVKQKEESSSVGNVSKTSNSSDESSSKDQNAITNKNLETTTTTKFDPTTGKPTETTTTTKHSESTDNSTKERKSLKTSYLRVDSVFNNVNTKYVTITTYHKTKNVDADKSVVGNLGGKWGLILMGLLVLGGMIAYWFVRRKFN